MDHGTSTVHAFQQKLISYLKAENPNITKVMYMTDGCAEQYKNR